MWEEVFYKVKYLDKSTNASMQALISAPPSKTIERVREILSEVYPRWEIESITVTLYTPIDK